MYKKFHIYNKRLYPFIRNMLDTNRQKYTKNNAIIKRKLSFSTFSKHLFTNIEYIVAFSTIK